MHKGIDNYKDNCYYLKDVKKAVDEHRTVFLDIDGVLQPGSQKRHDHDNESLKKYLYEKYSDSRYLDMKDYDAGAVFYDWKPSAVGYLKEILDTTYSNIVLSSDWRSGHSWDELKAFFKLYDLDDYLVDRTPFDDSYKKIYTHDSAIKEYLNNHPEIKKYIILDDINFYSEFGENFRLVKNKYGSLCVDDYEYARVALNTNPNIEITNDTIKMDDFLQMHYQMIEENGYKLMYMDSIWCKYKSLDIDMYLSYMLAYIYKRMPDIDHFFIKDDRYTFDNLGIGYKDSLGCYSISNAYDRDDTIYKIKRKAIKKG